MTSESLFQSVSNIRPEFLEITDVDVNGLKNKYAFRRVSIMVACACLLIAVAGMGIKTMMNVRNTVVVDNGTQMTTVTPSSEVTISSEQKTTETEETSSEEMMAESGESNTGVIEPVSFQVGEKAAVIMTFSQGFNLEKGQESNPIEEFCRGYKESGLLASRGSEVEIFYMWLFPEQFEENGTDILLVGCRTRSRWNKGEEPPEWAKNWMYAPGAFFMFDSEKKECIRMDTVEREFATVIRLLQDKSIVNDVEISFIDENNSSLIWAKEVDKLITFNSGRPVLENTLDIVIYLSSITGEEPDDPEEIWKENPSVYYMDNMDEVNNFIADHGGEYDYAGLENDDSVEWGIITLENYDTVFRTSE